MHDNPEGQWEKMVILGLKLRKPALKVADKTNLNTYSLASTDKQIFFRLKGNKVYSGAILSDCGPGAQIQVAPNSMFQHGGSFVKL